MLKITPTFILVAVCLGLAAIPVLNTPEPKKLELPMCDISPIVTTTIDMYVEQAAAKNTGLEVLTEKFERDIRMGNVTLKNSCVPVKRALGDVIVVDIPDYEPLSDEVILHDQLFKAVPLHKQLQYISEPNRYYGVLLHEFDHGVLGYTSPLLYGQFFVLHADWEMYVFEHELSHLSMANHEPKYAFDDNGPTQIELLSSAKYAHGTRCGGMGTLVYSHIGFFDMLPAYSSPNVFYGKETCGSEEANNAQQMANYAHFIRDKIAIAPKWDNPVLVEQAKQYIKSDSDNLQRLNNSTWQCIDHIAPLYDKYTITYHANGELRVQSHAIVLDSNNQQTLPIDITLEGKWTYSDSAITQTVTTIDVAPYEPVLESLINEYVEYNQSNDTHEVTIEFLSNDLTRISTSNNPKQFCRRLE